MTPTPQPPQPVPYLDLSRSRARIADELARRWRAILDANSFVLGPEVREFECSFCGYLEAIGVVGVANGTDALVVALRALDLAPGDEVIVPAFSFFASAEAVVLAGGTPVFCDVLPETFNLDPADAAARVTGRTVGIVGVHLYGRPFDFAPIRELCAARSLWLLEDAAQAHGARWRGRRVGTLGELAGWSFYPTKNLGAFGDGGAVSGMDEELMKRVQRIANHGQTSRYQHAEIGTNSRLDSLQAAVLNLKLATLEEDNAARRRLGALYGEGLADVGDLRLPLDHPDDEVVYHQLTVASGRRDALQEHLAAHGVGASVHYPSPLHRQPALAGLLPAPPELPVAERAAAEVLCLPMFAELTESEVARVIEVVRGFYGESAG